MAVPISRRSFPRWHASFSSEAAAPQVETSEGESSAKALSSPKLQKLFGRITVLPVEEVNILGALVIQVLGKKIFPGEFGGVGGGGGSVAAAPVEEEKVEKTSFDIKLVGFDAKAKIKVIKEVRAIAGLGLKEAKELVEGAPKIIQKGLKQDKADELKALLEAVGAIIEIV
jgi:large subunit ribosomal protein L7/L12